jgi:amino acid adenylation domain-containing protein
MPLDRPRPPVQSYRGHRRLLDLPGSLAGSVAALGRREGATGFMTLLAGFQGLMHRYSGQESVVVGTPIANRERPELEDLIGFFANTLALRADFTGDPGFAGLLAQVREAALGAYAHQDLPFEKLVEELQVERDLSRHPLFQATLVVQNATMPPLELPGLELSLLEVDWGTTAFDLSLFFWETALWEHLEPGLSLVANYNADLFDAPTVERLVGQLERLLAAAMAEPDRRLSTLTFLSQAERHQLLVEWRGDSFPASSESCLHRCFEHHAVARPDSIAVEYGGVTLTYGELGRRADRLAYALSRRGAGPEAIVALYLDPSPALIEVILAVLKAGCAYLPLTPDLPRERLALMLEDVRPALVVTCHDLQKSLPEGGFPVVLLDQDLRGESRELPEVSAEALAYVLYTSGSTGRPKPVGVPHRAIGRLVPAEGYVALRAEDRVGQIASPAFDAFTFELWAALAHGARLVGLGREEVLSADRFAMELRRREVSVLFLVTALFDRLAGAAPEAFGELRYLLFGGEEANPERVRDVLAAGRPGHLLHVYGPTEATTFSAWDEIEEIDAKSTALPIGRPLDGTELYVLDQAGDLAGLGIEGDLHVGGSGVARGYLGRPAATAEVFLPDPFSGRPGARLYRTGDRARFLAEGRLEFRGRRDRQVKIRGFRVEPEEVRSALARHPAVEEAAVTVREDRPGGRSLVAYVAPRAGAAGPVTAELGAFLRERLPAYMLPADFVILAALPRTPGGKLELTALPPPPNDEPSQAEGVPPSTPAESGLAAIWREILRRDRISVDDDFFALGGHSLDAVQVLARVRRDFGVELPVRTLYENPTLAGLARAVACMSTKGSRPQQ